MAHSAPPSPRRLTLWRLFGTSVTVAGVVLGAIAVVALQHPHGRTAPRSTLSQTGSEPGTSASASRSASKSARATGSASAKPTPTASKTTPASHPFALVVLSNTGSSGIAATAAARFRNGGWTVTTTGLFSGDILSTVAYYDPAVSGSQQAALDLQQEFPAIKRVKARFSGLPDGPIVVVLTTDYS